MTHTFKDKIAGIVQITLSGLACLAFFGGFVWMLLV